MIKLYDIDSYAKEFVTKVISCEKAKKSGYCITLEKTAFFPTAGGQEHDTGTIGKEKVSDVIINGETVIHITKNPIPIGEKVNCRIDWDARFRKMQHHTAEHIVSGLVHGLFGYNNIGFHLSDKDVTMDYDGLITEDELLLLEQKANEAVWRNIEVDARYPNPDELSYISYRAKLDLTENVRIVTIGDIDTCACCAPHVKHTGEIGIIHLRDMMRHRGGVRIRMICGHDALSDYEEKAKNVLLISNLLSAKQEDVAEATRKLLSQNYEKNQKISELSKTIAYLKAENIKATSGNICVFEENADTDTLRLLANLGKEKAGKIFCALNGNDNSGYSYILSSNTIDLQDAAAEINAHLSGKGGGQRDMIQGFFKETQETIKNYFNNYLNEE